MNNSLINYKMDKWSHIEFAFIPEELRHYYIRFHDSIVDEPYLSVHLSLSVFKTGVFKNSLKSFPQKTIYVEFVTDTQKQ